MRWGVTGGSGSLGSALIAELVKRDIGPIVTMSRDEVKTHLINQKYGGLSGEVRAHTVPAGFADTERLMEVFRGCDILVHAGALKRIDLYTYGGAESMLQANVLGTRNVLKMAVACGIKKVLIISSDKASSPINAYGISKAMGECLAVEENSFSIPRGTAISVARWGNCMGSRGSVLHLWNEQAKAGGPIKLTDNRMTRFWLTVPHAVELVLKWVEVMRGGEIFVPLLPGAKLIDLATAINPDVPIEVMGLRAGGEKLHEQMLNEEEPNRTLLRTGYYVVTPSVRSWSSKPYSGDPIPPDTIYRSDTSQPRLTVDDLKNLIAPFREEVTV